MAAESKAIIFYR